MNARNIKISKIRHMGPTPIGGSVPEPSEAVGEAVEKDGDPEFTGNPEPGHRNPKWTP